MNNREAVDSLGEMGRVYCFADEAGNFDFSRQQGATKYFILTTVTMPDCAAASELMTLRRELAWQGVALESTFHATEDKQIVRDEVFRFINQLKIRIDVTIWEKSKTQPHVQARPEYFYKLAWYTHFKHVAPLIVKPKDELLVIAAQIGTKKKQKGLRLGISDVVVQCAPVAQWEVAFWPATSDPCLQIADYCCWAVQRKWERGDDRSYSMIESKVITEYDFFRFGPKHYY